MAGRKKADPPPPAPEPQATAQGDDAGRKSRLRKSTPTPPPAVLPAGSSPSLLPEALEAVRALLGHCGEVKDQLTAFRQTLHGAAAELHEMHQRSEGVRQGLLDAQQLLSQLQPMRQVREELQNARQEAAEARDQTRATRQEMAQTEGSLGVLRRELETVRKELATRFRETGSRFSKLGEVCQEVQRDVAAVRQELQKMARQQSPATMPPAAGAEAPAPPMTAPPPTPVAAEVEVVPGGRLLGVTVGTDAVVVEVLPDTPAEKAGLAVGDVVLSVDGKPIKSSEDLRAAVDSATSKNVLFTVTRLLQTLEIPVVLSEVLAS